MSGMNSKLSAIIAAMIVFAGVITDAFGTCDTTRNKSADTAAEVSEADYVYVPDEEVLDVCDEYIFQVMDSADIESAARNNVKSERQTETIKETEAKADDQAEAEKTERETKTDDVTGTENETESGAEADMVISCSEEDYNNFLRIVEAEATGGDIKSKILVANVVINRVKRADFPNTVTEVIFQGNGEQFQPVMDGRFYTVTVTESTVEAVDRALYGEDYSQGATFFASVAYAGEGSWHARSLRRLFEYGGHVYFID